MAKMGLGRRAGAIALFSGRTNAGEVSGEVGNKFAPEETAVPQCILEVFLENAKAASGT